MIRGALAAAAVMALGWVGAGPAVGAEPAPTWVTGSEPLQVDSRSLEARGEEGEVVFEGDVVARQGDLTLQSDRLDVALDTQTRELRTVLASGHVRIQKGDLVATAEEATYEASAGILTLKGNPKVWRGQDVVTGERIKLYLAENRSVVEGAKAILFPGKPPNPEP